MSINNNLTIAIAIAILLIAILLCMLGNHMFKKRHYHVAMVFFGAGCIASALSYWAYLNWLKFQPADSNIWIYIIFPIVIYAMEALYNIFRMMDCWKAICAGKDAIE